MEPEDPYQVWEFRELTREANREEARSMLERVCKQVQPLMRRRRWRVKRVREFYPRNPSLLGLNVNRGQEIRVRLRPPHDRSRFYPYEFVLGTMLHELVHIVHGPHNASFYKLLDEITAEVEEDMAKGNFGSGTGFDGRSSGRLGGRGPVPVHNPNPAQLRAKMLRAAEERARRRGMLPMGPQRLGGSAEFARGLTPQQAAAKAAERRIKDDLWCGDASTSEADQGLEKLVDLTLDDDKEEVGGGSGCAANGRGGAGPSGSGAPANLWEVGGTVNLGEGCPAGCCVDLTMESDEDDEMAEAPPPERLPPRGQWSCKFCTLLNEEAITHCEACQQWRFSSGMAPVASNIKWNQT